MVWRALRPNLLYILYFCSPHCRWAQPRVRACRWTIHQSPRGIPCHAKTCRLRSWYIVLCVTECTPPGSIHTTFIRFMVSMSPSHSSYEQFCYGLGSGPGLWFGYSVIVARPLQEDNMIPIDSLAARVARAVCRSLQVSSPSESLGNYS
jgi:hypothetical protein